MFMLMLPAIKAELTQRVMLCKRAIPEIVQTHQTLDACVMVGIATVDKQIFDFD